MTLRENEGIKELSTSLSGQIDASVVDLYATAMFLPFLGYLSDFKRFCIVANGHTDMRTEGHTDRRMDQPSYRDAGKHLKRNVE